MTAKQATPKSKYGWSVQHDRALDLCIASYGTCPFGCGKNGAPNCYAIAVGIVTQCEPGKRAAAGTRP